MKTFKKYNDSMIGKYITTPTESGGVITADHMLIGDGSAYAGSAYASDNWFLYLLTDSNKPVLYVDDGHVVTSSNTLCILDEIIYADYSMRSLKDDYIEFIHELETPADVIYPMTLIVDAVFNENREKYKRIYEIITSEYDPLIDDSMSETVTHSGSDITTHGGTDTTTHGGTDTERHTGSDTTTHSGTDTDTHGGTDTERDGESDSVSTNVYPFDGSAQPKEVNTTNYGKTHSVQHGETIGTAYGHTITDAHGETISTQHGHTIGTAHGHTITDAHGERITKERAGSKGTSPELLGKHLSLWQRVDFVKLVAEDIIKRLTY